MRIIRASEISTFHYCHRAWWYQRKGTPSLNVEELTDGTKLHKRHGRTVFASRLTRTIAYGLLLIAIMLFTIYLTNQVL